MENKPIITCHGDQALFATLHSMLLGLLPKDPVEWKRSYGRARTVYVEAVFVPFSSEILPTTESCTVSLIGQPCFHTFWTDCDNDTYKSLVKEKINQWQTILRQKGASDWFIVLVNNEDKKNKLLPRSSVLDKIKNDFCGKSPDRCAALVEPLKDDARSAESWLNLAQRLRQLVLQSFTKHINKFEDNMRTQREKRTELGWNFSQYFMLQEELAFTFEMFGLYEESLIQYDELDALFTQFVVNHAAGETAQWLSSFSQDFTRWPGLDLTQLINEQQRALISQNDASLLHFRNYLFSRQCAMLFMLYRPWEVAQRAMPFMHNCLQEIYILDLPMPEGAISSWVFLSCLAVLDACERFADTGQVENYSLYTASLWEYARTKLWDLGKLCGLMPDCPTTSHHLNLVVDILAGIGGTDKMDCTDVGPSARLSAALSSKEAFQKHYMELAELAMGTFKHIGRYRSARLIGKDLADFYIRLGEYAKAEVFLSDAYKTYKIDGWERLADDTRMDIANCQKLQGCQLKYLKSCCHLASSPSLCRDNRLEFANELCRVATSSIENLAPVRLQPVLSLRAIVLRESRIVLNQTVTVQLDLDNGVLVPLHARRLTLCYGTRPEPEIAVSARSRLSSLSSATSATSFDLAPAVQHQLTNIPIDAPTVKSAPVAPGNLSPVGTVLSEVGKLQSRTLQKESEMVKDDYTQSLSAEDLVLQPGTNTVLLTGKVSNQGAFRFNQLCVQVERLELLHNFSTRDTVKFNVLCDMATISLQQTSGQVYLGVPQKLALRLSTGSYAVPPGAKLRLTSPDGLILGAGGKDNSAHDISVPETAPYVTLTFDVNVFAPLVLQRDKPVTHKILVVCEWLDRTVEHNQIFQHPFHIDHQLLTASLGRKYVRIQVENRMDDTFTLSDHQLVITRPYTTDDVHLMALTSSQQVVELRPGVSAIYVWQMKYNQNHCPPLTCHFQVVCRTTTGHEATFQHYFDLANYKTLFTVESDVTSEEAGQDCQAGRVCRLRVRIEGARSEGQEASTPSYLMYRITADEYVWSVGGKTTGVLRGEDWCDNTSVITLDMMPLVGGHLPLPMVELTRYQHKAPPERSGSEGGGDGLAQVAGVAVVTEMKVAEGPTSFHRGEVYVASRAGQVRVLPAINNSAIEVKVKS